MTDNSQSSLKAPGFHARNVDAFLISPYASTSQVTVSVSDVPHKLLTGLAGFPPASAGDSAGATARFILKTAISAYSFRISLGSLDDTSAASALYDLGMALCALAADEPDELQRDVVHKSAVSCLKEALKLDPMNDAYWNTLGNALFSRHPKSAQHAYIRALEIDTKVALPQLVRYMS